MLLVSMVACALFGPESTKAGAPAETTEAAPSEWLITSETYTDRSDRDGLLEIPFQVREPNEVTA